MNIKRLYLAIFRALDCLNDEQPNERLKDYLSNANPYLFKDRLSANPDIEEEYNKFLESYRNIDFKNPKETHNLAKKYVKTNTEFISLFEDISQEEWENLCEIIDKECDNENLFM